MKELNLKKYNLEKVIKDVSLRIKNHSYIACLEIQLKVKEQQLLFFLLFEKIKFCKKLVKLLRYNYYRNQK